MLVSRQHCVFTEVKVVKVLLSRADSIKGCNP